MASFSFVLLMGNGSKEKLRLDHMVGLYLQFQYLINTSREMLKWTKKGGQSLIHTDSWDRHMICSISAFQKIRNGCSHYYLRFPRNRRQT